MGELDSFVAAALKSIETADDEAVQAQLAFTLGDFPNLFERKVAAARARLEETYRELNGYAKFTRDSAAGTGGAAGGSVTRHDAPPRDRG